MRQAATRPGILWVLVVASMIASGTSWAGIGEGDGEIGFDVGITQFDEDFHGRRIALRGGYFVSDLLEIELEVCRSEKDGYFNLDLQTVVASAVFNIPAGDRIVPYLRAGIGLADLELAVQDYYYGNESISDSGAALQLGTGARFFVGGRTAIRVELSWLRENTFDEGSDYFSGTVGMTWRLGKKR